MVILKLNENQKNAISHLDGPMAVVSGPGSGKTTIIIYRLKNLVYNKNIKEKDILVVTFTKAAVYNMSKRYEEIIENKCNINFCTFHSLFFKIIRIHKNINIKNIINEKNKKDILIKILKTKEIKVDYEEELLKNIISEISFIINELIDINKYESKSISYDKFKKIFFYYENYKKENNMIDFDDMTLQCYDLLKSKKEVLNIWQNKFKYILIDEFQDINKLQYKIIKLISYPKNNLYIVGDDDQSIYGFRGGNPEILLNFKKDFEKAKILILNINYRSTEEIVKISNKIIDDNKIRYKKEIVSNNKKGNMPKILKFNDINSEALNITKKIKSLLKTININEICVLYRTKKQSYIFINTFMNFNIPYKLNDEVYNLHNHWVFKDIFSYMKVSLNRKNKEALNRIINKPQRFLNKDLVFNIIKENNFFLYEDLSFKERRSIEDILFYLDKISKKTPFEAIKYIRKVVGYDNYIDDYSKYYNINKKDLIYVLEEIQENAKNYKTILEYLNNIDKFIENEKLNFNKKYENKDGITLTTIHSAKGMEFNTVFVVGCVDGIIPYEKATEEKEIEEERRVFYVAVTRAKENLYISFTKTRYELEVKPTRFLDKIIKI